MSAAAVPVQTPSSAAPGPRTPEGKAASSRNSLKHGLTAKEVVLPDEDPAAYDALLAHLIEAHNPAPGAETLLVHQIAQGQWRLNRARKMELQALEHDLTAPAGQTSKLDPLLRYIAAIEREFHRAIKDLAALQKGAVRLATAAKNAQSNLLARETGYLNARSREHALDFRKHLEELRRHPYQPELQNEPGFEDLPDLSPALTIPTGGSVNLG